ncbi:MAG: OprD family outer membrane porin [Sulfuricurvum sp.]|nr:OprD family outer membrane porin [Sulfuricurvum sp.]
MKLVNLSIAAAAACVLATSAHALKTEDRVLKGNMQVEYTKAPGDVNSFTEMFTKGEAYGRLRSNMFWWDWDNDNLTSTDDNNMWGLGGSIVYKTGFFHGLGATAGFYGSIPMVDENKDPSKSATANFGKAGKDTYHTRADGSEGSMGNFAEAYLEYKNGKTNAKLGRQLIDSKMLASNDTKMIPNSFEALVIENKNIPDTTVRAAYIMSQKLRDHQTFHSLIAYEKYNQNDDSGVHKGLSVAKINAAGEDVNPEMLLLTASNKSVKNLKLDAEYVGLSGFFNTVVAEANYQIQLSDSWTVTPGVRYLKQMDNGAGAIGGAALSGSVTAANGASKGYSNGGSVDGSIIMARVVAASGPLELQAGYAKISDDADIIAPWRGFPTGGYVRSMAQVDWLANTQNWAVKASYDFGKAGIVSGFKVAADYENINQDEAKGYVDRDIIHVDMWKTFKEMPNTEFKFRVGIVGADKPAATDNESYNEYRFEMNYLF